MRYDTWRPVYESILDSFGYDSADDEQAREELALLCNPFDHRKLATIRDATVAICGGADCLDEERSVARRADVVVAASVAADTLREAHIDIDLMVTDLDKNPDTARQLTHDGIPVAAHGHGDNIDCIQREIPEFDDEFVLPTVQCAPTGPTENFGGFTDGDRAAFIADAFGAAELRFAGWDFDDPTVGDTKRAKLDWAARLLYWLEQRRGEQFTVLDDRRESLTLPPGSS
ncbi:MAG: 6-hydroxymethylpterin diphosphokinase MptE-like protein [Halobacteriales archaeon]|nr:6-hydroxymethylpterin diphosphokinase MptE-like protein [Halobacteriales archaeon]